MNRHGLDKDRVTVLEGRCRESGASTPYLPFLDALRRGLHLREEDSAEQGFEHLCVMRIGRRHPGFADQTRVRIHAHMQLVAAGGLAPLERPGGIGVFGIGFTGAGRTAMGLDQAGVYQRTVLDQQPLAVQLPVQLPRQLGGQPLPGQSAPEPANGGFIGHPIVQPQSQKAPE